MNPIGSTLQERYQILERLGHNGSVTTYLAIDTQIPGNLQLKCAVHSYPIADPTPDSPDWQKAIDSAQRLYDVSRRVDRLPIVYSYFVEDGCLYIVREFIAGVPFSQELATRTWTQSQIVMLLADLLEVLREIERCEVSAEPVAIEQIVRRQLDGKLVLVNLPRSISCAGETPLADNLQAIGFIAIAAAIGTGSPLTASQILQWQQLATQIDRPEPIAIIDRLIARDPESGYPSALAAWQAIAGAIPQLLVHQHSPADTRLEIAKHLRLLVERGTEFYEVGNCEQAIAVFDRALALDPQCVDAYCGRGNARRFIGDYPGSWDDFDRAIALAPDLGVAYIGRGLGTCFGSPSTTDPTADFELGKSLLVNPTTAIEYVMRGTAQAQLGDAEGAIADYDRAIAIDPRLLLAYNNRGNLRQYLGNMAGAIADFSQVLKIDSHSAIAYNNRAIIYTQSGQYAPAIADFTKAIELQPDFISVYNNLGNAYYQMGKHPAAIDNYSQAIARDPDFAVAYSNRANIYRIDGNLTAALADYDRAISLDPGLVIAYYNRGICQRQMGNHQAAIDDYSHTLALDRQYFHAYYHRGNARQYIGDKQGAIADYTHTICFDPNHLHAYYNRAISRSALGDVQGAMEDIERAIKLSPNFARAYYHRAWLLATNHEHQYALADYQRAIDLQPNYLDAYYQRGCSHQSLGNFSAAVADFCQTIAIDACYAPAYYQRGKVHTQIGDRAGAISDYHQAANLYLDRGDSKTYQQILAILDRLGTRF
ncbi:tetratricopeptide repeat protein [Chamaesiphon sp. GL140_3_metabinner_50]|uniref:tetratricopeptide repeat protein n=1 Tax=Chamaesiphon sp. GL140_3_metabinner_50 TaxID=2970812 RepID=UPI0025E2DE81|nr:tetratricopeptide repeat protein [Chamaesiphon sp. GL140_3_metabinner_50]